jgi:5-methyltetrahydrofolate--homocysteine methyltransferase
MSDDLYKAISKAVMEGEDGEATKKVDEALKTGSPPLEVMQRGVVDGITRAGEKWKANEYFLPDVILAADAFKAAMAVLKPHLKGDAGRPKGKKFVIGVVQGDVHDLGKSLVIAMLTSAGFEVVDLGIDVPLQRFMQAVREQKPDILGLGAYMTTTMLEMKEVIAELEKQGLRRNLKIMVGGVPTSQEFANEVRADAWGKNAIDAMQKAQTL